MAGIVAPALTGVLVDSSGGFGSAFAVSAAVNILGFIGWVFILPPIAPRDWTRIDDRSGTGASAAPT
jgi:hypothetical protein